MAARTRRILVVDDDPAMRHLLWLTLRPLGVHLAFCAGPAAAAERLSREPFDLLVTDHDMPGESGLELVQRIRQDPEHPNRHVPVIVVSAFDVEAHRTALREAGVTHVLSKPFRPHDLQALVLATLGDETAAVRRAF